ncbi:hypothetical protein [Tractidigestivibacter scatoligenes]|jgi:hypothetical protein|nr:hypothetical protein [Tractidigestivibacter scatoligenes]
MLVESCEGVLAIHQQGGMHAASRQGEESAMGVSVDSKIKALAKNEAAADIICKYSPGFKTDPQMKMVYGLTLRKLASFPQAKELADHLDEIDAELKALGD